MKEINRTCTWQVEESSPIHLLSNCSIAPPKLEHRKFICSLTSLDIWHSKQNVPYWREVWPLRYNCIIEPETGSMAVSTAMFNTRNSAMFFFQSSNYGVSCFIRSPIFRKALLASIKPKQINISINKYLCREVICHGTKCGVTAVSGLTLRHA